MCCFILMLSVAIIGWLPVINCQSLTIHHLDEDYIYGNYSNVAFKESISFISTPSSLLVETALYNDGHYLLVSSIKKSEITSTVLMDGKYGFITYKGKDISVSMDTISKGRNNAEYFTNIIISSNYSTVEVSYAINDILQSSLLEILIEIGIAFNKRSGDINGRRYPSVVPLFKFILNLILPNYKSYSNNSTQLISDDDECLSYCPPCPEQECIGLCGYGCSCWSMVCGDCCYHLGCYDHDVCCRDSFFSIDCLLPFGFQCEEHYYCNNNNNQ